MMRTVMVVSAMLIGGGLMIGCDREDTVETPTTPPQVEPTVTPAEREAEDIVNRAGANVREGAAEVGAAAEGAVNSVTGEQAQKLLDQAQTYIKENKYDLADQTLDRLEANRASLPETVRTQLPNVRKMLDNARSGSTTRPATNR